MGGFEFSYTTRKTFSLSVHSDVLGWNDTQNFKEFSSLLCENFLWSKTEPIFSIFIVFLRKNNHKIDLWLWNFMHISEFDAVNWSNFQTIWEKEKKFLLFFCFWKKRKYIRNSREWKKNKEKGINYLSESENFMNYKKKVKKSI